MSVRAEGCRRAECVQRVQVFVFLSAALYNGALTNISGAVGGKSFSDAAGGNAVTSNDAYRALGAPSATDILVLLADLFQIGAGEHMQMDVMNVRLFSAAKSRTYRE